MAVGEEPVVSRLSSHLNSLCDDTILVWFDLPVDDLGDEPAVTGRRYRVPRIVHCPLDR